jgi:hypothetical protein
MNIAELVRIYENNPSDDFVTKREIAMVAVAGRVNGSKSVTDLFNYANSLSAGLGDTKLTGDFADICIAELSTASPSFVAEANETQVFVCALGACLTLLNNFTPSETERTAKEVFAASIHAGLSFQPASSNAKVGQAVQEILDRSASAFRLTSEVSRKRAPVADLDVSFEESDTATSACEKVVESAQSILASLQRNAVLDREELELLWFCLGDHSSVLNVKLSTLKPSVGLVASALETNALLRRLPSTSHVNMAMRNVAAGKGKTLKALVSENEAHRQEFLDYLADEMPLTYPSLLPVVSAILGYSQPRDDEVRVMSEWGRRLVLELGLTKLKNSSVI